MNKKSKKPANSAGKPKAPKAPKVPRGNNWMTPEYREHMALIGRMGGQSRSDKKKKASKRNLKRAMQAKFPKSPRFDPQA